MNLPLLESFGQNYPEELDGPLDSMSMAVTCAFNKRGSLLAVGCNDGRIVIWDFLTRGIAKIIPAHAFQVFSLCWSRNGRRILASSGDGLMAIWDVVSGHCVRSFRFPNLLLKSLYNPRNENMIMACTVGSAPLLIEVDEDEPEKDERQLVPLDKDDPDTNVVATFDRRGTYIFTGNSKGKILVFKSQSLELVASFQVTTGTSSTTAIKDIVFARRGESFLVNSADRVIRVYESGEVLACAKGGEPEPVQKLQDLVNKTQWKQCVFSGDGEYICAGSLRQHALYIWEKITGNLVKILHGTKGETLLFVAWHPVRPIVCSISTGVVSVWAQSQLENWSAFTPDFRELEENFEYEETEGEFDSHDEDKSIADAQQEEEDIDVDVEAVESIQAFLSSDEEEEDANTLVYLPISAEVENPEDCIPATLSDGEEDTKSPLSKRSRMTFEEGASGEYAGAKRSADRPKKSGKNHKKKSSSKGTDQ